jgi:serine/threonine-protein kinase
MGGAAPMTAPTRVGRYEIVRQIGRSMTDVCLAIDTVGNRKTALKLIPSKGDAHSRLVMEAERRGAAIQRELRGLDPRVVEVYETGDLDGYFFVAMQYVEGRDLAEVLDAERTIDSVRAAAIALEICEQLTKFHTWQSAVVHGDIKPSNIHLGPNDTVRLLDFGIAKTLRADCDATVSNFGSPSYCSPERLTRSEIDQQSDLWAVGATLYQMLSGSPPYQAENTRKLESLIRSKRPPRALPPGCPAPLRAIAMKALAPEAARRYRSWLPIPCGVPAGPSSHSSSLSLILRPVARTHCCVSQSFRYPRVSPGHTPVLLHSEGNADRGKSVPGEKWRHLTIGLRRSRCGRTAHFSASHQADLSAGGHTRRARR